MGAIISEGSSRATRYSPYFLELDPSSKERYKEKLTIAGGIDDPYVLTNDISGIRLARMAQSRISRHL